MQYPGNLSSHPVSSGMIKVSKPKIVASTNYSAYSFVHIAAVNHSTYPF